MTVKSSPFKASIPTLDVFSSRDLDKPAVWPSTAQPSVGLAPLHVARNEGAVDAARLRGLAAAINGHAGTRRKIWHTYAYGFTPFYAPATCVFRTCGHTSPNVTELKYSVLCSPTASTDATISPCFYFVRKALDTSASPATETSTTLSPTYVSPRQGTSYKSQDKPDSWFVRSGSIAVSEQTTYAIEMYASDSPTIIGATLYESIFTGLIPSASSGTWADPSHVRVNDLVLDREVADYIVTMDTLRKRQSAPFFSWSTVGDDYTFNTHVTASNLFDPSYSNWDAAAPGFWCAPYYRGTLSSTNVPVIGWMYGNGDSGGVPRLYQRTDTTSVITGIVVGTTTGYYFDTSANNMDSSQDFVKVDVTHKGGVEGKGIYTYATGMYPYVA